MAGWSCLKLTQYNCTITAIKKKNCFSKVNKNKKILKFNKHVKILLKLKQCPKN